MYLKNNTHMRGAENQTSGASQDVASVFKGKRTYSTAEFAEQFGVSRKKVNAWIRSRKLRIIPACVPHRIPISEAVRFEKGELK